MCVYTVALVLVLVLVALLLVLICSRYQYGIMDWLITRTRLHSYSHWYLQCIQGVIVRYHALADATRNDMYAQAGLRSSGPADARRRHGV